MALFSYSTLCFNSTGTPSFNGGYFSNNFDISSSVIFEFATIINLVEETFGVKVFFSPIKYWDIFFRNNILLIYFETLLSYVLILDYSLFDLLFIINIIIYTYIIAESFDHLFLLLIFL